ncbi:MAG: hypothetical protein KDB27_29455, partial [Planctomycetales bacterium]|nr:hypothetical protein [Planctomycetales bacterium]
MYQFSRVFCVLAGLLLVAVAMFALQGPRKKSSNQQESATRELAAEAQVPQATESDTTPAAATIATSQTVAQEKADRDLLSPTKDGWET